MKKFLVFCVFVSILLLFTIFYITKEEGLLIPVLDEKGNVVRQEWIKTSFPVSKKLSISETVFTVLDTTPDVVRNQSIQQFPSNSPYWIDKRNVFGVDIKNSITVNSNNYSSLLGVYYITEVSSSIAHDLCNLNNGIFTWALTNDYQLTFGQVMTDIEWSVKHKQLVGTLPVYAAGEMNITKPLVIYNLNSGSYSTPLINQQNAINQSLYYETVLQQKMQAIWNVTNCPNLNYPFTVLNSNTELFQNATITSQTYVQTAICNTNVAGFIWSSYEKSTLCCIINNCNYQKDYTGFLIAIVVIVAVILAVITLQLLLKFCKKSNNNPAGYVDFANK